MSATTFARVVLAAAGLAVTGEAGLPTQPSATAQRTFYVSSSTGRDTCSGMMPSCPWATLARVSEQAFAPGDRILLKSGDRFAGQLRIASSGAPGRPLTIAAYGAGARPLIDGAADHGGAYATAILVRNQHDIEIRGLEIANSVDHPRDGEATDTAAGILVVNDRGGMLAHFHFADLHIRDVYASAMAHRTEDEFNNVTVSGIRFQASGTQAGAPPSFFRDIRIAGNRIEHTGRFGVQIGNGGGDGHSRDPETGFNRDIVIADNKFFELGGSAVQLAGARYALIENNDFDHCGSSVRPDRMVGRGSGAWVVNSRDIVAQRNRSRHVRGYKDSYGMHVDFGNLNVLYQYNYSEDSEGGFVEILGNNRNVIWRYNISVNDGLREKEGNTLWFSTWSPNNTPSSEIYIYNNTIFVRSGLFPDLSLTASDAHIWNNIFQVAPHAMIGEQLTIAMPPGGLDLHDNVFFGKTNGAFTTLGARNLSADPRALSPGAAASEGYRLSRGSPAIGTGTVLPDPVFPAAGQGVFAAIPAVPRSDFFGNPLGMASRNVGAYGGSGE